MLATINSAALQGIDAELVFVEVNAGEAGDPKLILVGLPDAAVKESDDRVFSALSNSGYRAPRTRTTINLAPGHVRKEGPFYDLPIALGILAATRQLNAESLSEWMIAGELSLSGATRPVRGALAMARLARRLGKRGLLLPGVSAEEAACVEGIAVYRIESLDSAVRFLSGATRPVRGALAMARLARRLGKRGLLLPGVSAEEAACVEGIAVYRIESLDSAVRFLTGERVPEPLPVQPLAHRVVTEGSADFAEIKGQHALRRAVEVAVAGNHNLLMIGPPGAGKSMIAKRVPTIMPAPALEEQLEIVSIHSAAGRTLAGELPLGARPFRAPHHTISDVGLLGGGSIPGPGEISLAHNGVLFLDELPEFKRSALEVLRQPLEDGDVTISRSAGKITLPCAFLLISAMNPCPCGYLGDSRHECRCSPTQIQRYRSRISGPLLDRIDIHIEAPALSLSELRSEKPGESSAAMRARVEASRFVQRKRFHGTRVTSNARMTQTQIRRHCAIDSALGDLLQHAMEQLSLSARAYDRILKVARTIADLAGSEAIGSSHLLEAIQYRSLDRAVFY